MKCTVNYDWMTSAVNSIIEDQSNLKHQNVIIWPRKISVVKFFLWVMSLRNVSSEENWTLGLSLVSFIPDITYQQLSQTCLKMSTDQNIFILEMPFWNIIYMENCIVSARPNLSTRFIKDVKNKKKSSFAIGQVNMCKAKTITTLFID